MTIAARNQIMRIAFVLAMAAVLMAAPAPAMAFDDLADSVHRDDIGALEARGVVRGCDPPANTRFCPDEPMTRGQMAALLHRAFSHLATDGFSPDFVDIGGSVFRDDIRWLAATGITRGCDPPDNRRFCPDESVTRGAMAAFLVRALQLPAGRRAFADMDGHVFAGDVGRLLMASLTSGCNPPADDRFCPDRTVTRAEAASFVWRAMESVTGGRPGLRSFDVEGHPMVYCGNGDVDAPADHAVVVIHGDTRNPCDYARAVLDAALPDVAVRVIAPLFPIDEDGPYLDRGLVRWRGGRWKWGGYAHDAGDRAVSLSSFDVIDAVVRRLRAAGTTSVVVAGHSAGGQLVNRYTGGGEESADRYVVANPSSYVYLDGRRWNGSGFAAPDGSCDRFDAWKYGLQDLRGGVVEVGAETFRRRMGLRSVVYLLGSEDVTNAHQLDTSCPAMLQGRHRLERGLLYVRHLAEVLTGQAAARHQVEVIDGVGHSQREVFDSEPGRRALFAVD